MSELRWKWCRVNKPGLWAWAGNDEKRGPEFPQVTWRHAPDEHCGWRCYLGPIPTILPPEPELRLPDGLVSDIVEWNVGCTVRLAGEDERYIDIWHPNKDTAIRMAQAAVDAMESKCESS